MTARDLTPHRWLLPVVAVAAAAVYVLFSLFSGTMLRCPFKWVTGLDCPGCGSQRAIRAFFAGDPGEAWSYNLLLPFLLLYLLVITLLPLCGHGIARRIHAALTSASAAWILLGVVIFWTIIRNLINV